jgi:hypothetical protein
MNQLKEQVEAMPKEKHIQLARILIHEHKVEYTENQNGIFINLSKVSPAVLTVIQDYYKTSGL